MQKLELTKVYICSMVFNSEPYKSSLYIWNHVLYNMIFYFFEIVFIYFNFW